MAKKRSLLDFSDVGNDTKDNTNTSTDTVIKVKEGQSLNHAISEFYSKPDKIEKKQVSIYLDADVIEALNKFGKLEGKGARSELVNNFLKKTFNIRQDS